jgi:LysR family transcriptional regulator, benzoate and cis,cis-muconate-responsive activator of ben and cat genes
MELRQLRYFVVAAEEGNIGRAAQRLGISQPPISRQVHALEKELGTKLFLRTPKGVELTDPGEVFYNYAQLVLINARNAVDRTRAADRGELGRLDVGFFGSTGYRAVPCAPFRPIGFFSSSQES